jgi:DegV family protein with EDD domain
VARLVLVTDSTADLPAAVAQEHGILVARARYAFREHTFTDGEQSPEAFYGRIHGEGALPAPFGTPEAAFKELFERAIRAGDSPVCIVAPFDVNPSFTTAIAAMLSIDGADMKVLNAGIASAGLCSMLVSLAQGIAAGWERQRLLDAVDELGPQCDTLFVPHDVAWLESAGRLGPIEERLGETEGAIPVVRVSTRISGVALADTHAAAIAEAAARAGARAKPGRGLIVTIDHAVNPDLASAAAAEMSRRWKISKLITTALSSTIGAQLGPGAVGIGVAPAQED